jgi:hypothetical protein
MRFGELLCARRKSGKLTSEKILLSSAGYKTYPNKRLHDG